MKTNASTILEALNSMNLNIPKPPMPGGNYSATNLMGNRLTVSIQFPIYKDQFRFQGKLGEELTTDDGYLAAQLCSLNVLAQIQKEMGFQRLFSLNHLHLYYRSSEKWDEAPKVADGASDFFNQVLGSAGKHSRSLTGVAALPRKFSTGLVTDFTVHF
ncbi:RidA family protein [Algoriphagus hitonicola]|uniref:Enamine deaminase RidA, house cleaning of reactive enamine intermediates, YjgF/YER057c/UK114 family n=1 Tax=Algoriphagus hitonicola TaxID=435880 RepID=A0A1I2Q610_9BACT|nr:RidA family protein [Algoriphagus hitonicola]SFG23360.1 Enamine deaminase RidA, house cleaning of reactive enamine intermediates, YjgF/YER057c/UK114 family [Algoriphagus hitonicola]